MAVENNYTSPLCTKQDCVSLYPFMKPRNIFGITIILLILISTSTLYGQRGGPSDNPDGDENSALSFADDGFEIARKEPSIFSRPKAKTAALQLELARELESRGKLSRAANAYNALIHKWHNSPEAPLAQLALAEVFKKRCRYERAFDEYQYLITHFAGRSPLLDIVDRQYEIANHLNVPAHSFLGIRLTSKADIRMRYEKIVRNAPHWKFAPETMLKIGDCFEDEGDDLAAADVYARLQIRYPNSHTASEAAGREVGCRYRLATRYPKDEGLRSQAITAVNAALFSFPGHPSVTMFNTVREDLIEKQADAAYERALFYDIIAKKQDAALIAYREFLRQHPGSRHVATVRERIQQLTAEEINP